MIRIIPDDMIVSVSGAMEMLFNDDQHITDGQSLCTSMDGRECDRCRGKCDRYTLQLIEWEYEERVKGILLCKHCKRKPYRLYDLATGLGDVVSVSTWRGAYHYEPLSTDKSKPSTIPATIYLESDLYRMLSHTGEHDWTQGE